jgi:hypothetical protein
MESVGFAINTTIYYDNVRKQYDLGYDLVYKVVADIGGVVYSSPTVSVYPKTPHENIVREMLRKESLYLERKVGVAGLLLKRRNWGTRCTACMDPFTGDVKSSQCDICYGTGFVGGFFPAMSYPLDINGSSPRTKDLGEIGLQDALGIQARGYPCPWVSTGDVWISCADDKRYVVKGVQPVLFLGRPVALSPIALMAIPTTDIVYQIPNREIVTGEGQTPAYAANISEGGVNYLYVYAESGTILQTFQIDNPVVAIETIDNLLTMVIRDSSGTIWYQGAIV